MRRFSQLSILSLLMILALPMMVCSATSPTATPVPDHITLTWTGNPATTMTITWRTDVTVSSGNVEYQKSDDLSATILKTQATPTDFNTNNQQTRLFSTTLSNLSPNTTYTYRVGDEQNWSNKHSFTTADPKATSFRFLVFGDSQSAEEGDPPYGQWGQTLHAAYKTCPDARFFVNVGDLVDAGQSGAHWNGWFAAAAGVIDRIPAMPVVGNHETVGSADTKCPIYWIAQFNLPRNAPAELNHRAYSYDYGNLHAVVLDSQPCGKNQLELQSKWLDTDLTESTAAWKIVFYHKGSYSLVDSRDNKSVREAFSPIIEKHQVDVVFNAHDHGIGRTYPIKNGKYMSKPSEGTVYYVAGRSGAKYYTNTQKMEWDNFFHISTEQPNYFILEVGEKKLTVKTVMLNGTVVDTYTIEKEKATGQNVESAVLEFVNP